MEIRFCDVCSESIPDSDFDAGRAVTVNGKHMHVACSMRRALSLGGPRSWLTFLLALFAAGVATYLLIAELGRDERPDVVTQAERAAFEEGLRASEKRIAEDVSRRMAEAMRENAGLRDAATKALRDDVSARLNLFQANVDGAGEEIAGHIQAHGKRLTRLEDEITALNGLMREIKEQADRDAELRRRAAAAPPPQPEPEPAPIAQTPPPPTEPTEPERDPGHDQEVERWIQRLKDANENIRFSATLELGRLKDLRATAPLVQVLEKDKDYYVRLGAATALGDLKAVDAVPALIEALNDSDALVRTAANDALQAISEQPFEFVPGMSKSERRKLQKQWKGWFEENETALRDRLGQPASS